MGPRRPHPVALRIHGPLARSDLPGLLARACALLDAHPEGELRCELHDVACDAVAVDALARLALAARRRGRSVQLSSPGPEMLDLIAFAGLAQLLPASPTPAGGAAARTEGRSSPSPGRT